MATPATRAEFKNYCLRRLGHPVIEVNIDDDQMEDRIDEALEYYRDYHFDGSEKLYYKYQITANNRSDSVYDVQVKSGGTGYSNSDTVVYTGGGGNGFIAPTANVVTDANGSIISITQSTFGDNYATAPNVTVTSGGGSGAVLEARLGGFIELPENIFGVVRIFDISSALNVGNIFSIQYQIVLNDLYNLTAVSMVPYYQTFSHLRLMEELLVGQQPIRYNRHRNILHVDTSWDRFDDDQYLIVEAYEVVDPDEYTDVWNDRWLKKYATALFKRQWGFNTKKYGQMQLPGGMFFNGQQIYDEAIQEISDLEDEMINTYSLPVSDMIGAVAMLLGAGLITSSVFISDMFNTIPMA